MRIVCFIMVLCLLLFSNSYARDFNYYENKEIGFSLIGPKGWFKKTGEAINLNKVCKVEYAKYESLPIGGPNPTFAVLVNDADRPELPEIKTALDYAKWSASEMLSIGFTMVKPPQKIDLNGIPVATLTCKKKIGDFITKGRYFFILKERKIIALLVLDKTDGFDTTLSECKETIDSFRFGGSLKGVTE